jgi:hypothetical protein
VLTTSQQVPFHADVKKLVDHILPRIFEAWATEDDKWVFVLVILTILSPLIPLHDENLYSAHFDATARELNPIWNSLNCHLRILV